MVFYLLELSQLPHRCSIAELHSPIELIFTTSKIFARSWLELASSPGPRLEPARSFAFHLWLDMGPTYLNYLLIKLVFMVLRF